MVAAHIENRDAGHWMTDGELKRMTKGGQFSLHANSVQALAEKLIANVRTTFSNIKREKEAGLPVTSKFPHRIKDFQNVVWKGCGSPALKIDGRRLSLSNGRGNDPLILTLPSIHSESDIAQAELDWQADHYVLLLTIDTGETNPPLLEGKRTAGCDLGEINIAAVVTEEGEGIVISGRHLRSVKQLRNKRHSDLDRLLQRCKKGSKRHRKLMAAKNRASSKAERQQRDILHRASRKVVDFCEKEKIATIAVGDVRDIADGVNKGKKTNQKISQWTHGLFTTYLKQKSRVFGINVRLIDEAYSTRTCSHCGNVRTSSPKGRIFICPSCGVRMDRDGNGAANICSKHRFGEFGSVQPGSLSHIKPIIVGHRSIYEGLVPSSRAADVSRGEIPVASVV
jgi:putative transposase